MLTFGTGGIRAVMGDGDNQINRKTVANATHALASVILEGTAPKSCAIAYDTRYQSKEFAELTAGILASYGIEAYCFDMPVPTPTLSFAIRAKKIGWGVVITASHNSKEYNGYKVYDFRGVQAVPDLTEKIAASMGKAVSEEVAKDFSLFGPDILSQHVKACYHLIPKMERDIPIVYSALYGTGAYAVPELLNSIGFTQINKVQTTPDPNFGGLYMPNPEEYGVYAEAISTAEKTGAELICATDPDCDRVGAAVKRDGKFICLTGNQIAAVLLDSLLPYVTPQDVIITTNVSGYLCRAMAEACDIEVKLTPPGFKYIGDQAERISYEGKRFFFGYEENYGYLFRDAVRDKDAVLSTALICVAASRLAEQGKTLYDRWVELSDKYGYFNEKIQSISLNADTPVKKIRDVIMELACPEDTELLVRPSGTEPKLKIYYRTKGETSEHADRLLQELEARVHEVLAGRGITAK